MKQLLLLLLVPVHVFADEPNYERQQELRNLVMHDCGACHGMKLSGGLGPSLLPDALAGKSNEYLYETIAEGRPGTAMPPWKTFINKNELFWLIRNILRQQ